jgi:hypothetical protein
MQKWVLVAQSRAQMRSNFARFYEFVPLYLFSLSKVYAQFTPEQRKGTNASKIRAHSSECPSLIIYAVVYCNQFKFMRTNKTKNTHTNPLTNNCRDRHSLNRALECARIYLLRRDKRERNSSSRLSECPIPSLLINNQKLLHFSSDWLAMMTYCPTKTK